MGRKYSIEDAKKIAQSRNGKCLSTSYVGCDHKLVWQCENNHIWEATFFEVKNGSWCKQCHKLTIEEMQTIAVSKNGKCLSETYTDNRTYLSWQCEKGHIWKAPPGTIKKGSWCKRCATKKVNDDLYEANRKNKLKLIKKISKEKGGECLSSKVEHACSKLQFKCHFGHTWEASALSILNGTWCPYCHGQNVQESMIRIILQKLLDCKIKKYKPKDLLSPNGGRLEFDFWNEDLNLAGEHQGAQHFGLGNYMHSQEQFKQRQLYDQIKRDYCKSNKIKYFETKDLYLLNISLNNKKEIIDYLSKILKKKKLLIKTIKEEDIDFSGIYILSERLNEFKEIAKEKGGECLSQQYINRNFKLEFKCKEGHIWKANPQDIKAGSWCPTCNGGVKKITTEYCKNLVESKGGKLLSEYKSYKHHLLVECAKGHQWNILLGSLNAGCWCPFCFGRYKYSTEQMHELAKRKNGKLLSEKYINCNKKLYWECEKGHKFWMSPRLARESWCRQCYLDRCRAKKKTPA